MHYVCGDPLNCSYLANVGINNVSTLPSLIEVYPNPATNNFSINLERLVGNNFTLELYDAQGRLVVSRINLSNEK